MPRNEWHIHGGIRVTAIDVFARFPRITTERLVLRQITPEDAEALFAVFSDEVVLEFYDEPLHHSINDSRDLIRRQQGWYARREGIRWGISRKGEEAVIGSCGLYNFDEDSHRAETGYELRRDCWRQGIMREALGAMLSFAFGPMALHRVEALVDGENARSQGLLRGLGFAHEGTLRQRFFAHGAYHDDWYFGLLRDEWPAPAIAAVEYTLVEATT